MEKLFRKKKRPSISEIEQAKKWLCSHRMESRIREEVKPPQSVEWLANYLESDDLAVYLRREKLQWRRWNFALHSCACALGANQIREWNTFLNLWDDTLWLDTLSQKQIDELKRRMEAFYIERLPERI